MRLFELTVCTALLGAAASAALAAESRFNFSAADNGWKSNHKQYAVKLSADYLADGKRGLLFTGPQWDGKKPIWPSCETHSIPVRDWSGYDRLVVTVYNDGDSAMLFGVIIGDSKARPNTGIRFLHGVFLPHRLEQLVVPLKEDFAKRKVNPADISFIHLFTENPLSMVRFFVGDFTLLKPGEAVPEPPEGLWRKIRGRQAALAAPQLNHIEAEAAGFDYRGLPPEAARFLRERVDAQLALLRSGESDDQLISMRFSAKNNMPPPPDWSSVRSLASAMSGFEALRKAVSAAPGFEDVLLGYATPMEKVLPRAPVIRPLPETMAIEAARGEKEAAQLIVIPLGKDRRKVGVRLTSFTGSAGTLPDSAVSAVPVGFVETTFASDSGSEYVGFWPDPLLSFLDSVDVKAGEAQMFWIKADIPTEQPAGVYGGKAEVMVDGERAFSVPVSIRVRDFTLPNHSMLPLAVTFWPNDNQMPECNPAFDPETRKSPAAPVNAWIRHKKEWRDMLAGYYIMIDSLYDYDYATCPYEPQFELLAELGREGRLGLFNLGSFGLPSENPADFYEIHKTIDRLRPRYEKAKRLGILKHAYIYGADEIPGDKFAVIERCIATLKREFPDVPLLTTARDNSYGTDGRLKSIDWFCPLTPYFNETQAIAARKAGKRVWWYICLSPRRPFANNFIESTGIETRLLMGAMSAKYRPDGFLYYQTSLWNDTSPIASGPYTGWNAQSFPRYNGDGNWTYPGPDSTPLGSIRLENFRDGLEDYAFVKILEQRLAAARRAGKSSQWQQEAEEALKVPASLVETQTRYTRDPQKVYAWRSRLADLIESAPVK